MDPLKHAYNIEDFDNFFKFTVASLLRGRSMKVCTHLTQLVDMVCDIKGKLGRGVEGDEAVGIKQTSIYHHRPLSAFRHGFYHERKSINQEKNNSQL